jgi:hypothetical protein
MATVFCRAWLDGLLDEPRPGVLTLTNPAFLFLG